MALFTHEIFAAYDESGFSTARNLIQAAFPGSPAAKIADIAERAAQSNEDAQAGMDDDIPF